MRSSRWTGQQGASVKQLGGPEVTPDSQAKGQGFRRTPPHAQQVKNKKVINARESPDRQGSKRPKPTNHQLWQSAMTT